MSRLSVMFRKAISLIATAALTAGLALVGTLSSGANAAPLASCVGVSTAFGTPKTFANLSVTGNGTRSGNDWKTDNTTLSFRYFEESKACQQFVIIFSQISSGLSLDTTTGTGSTACEAGPWAPGATGDRACFITIDNTGTATFDVSISGAATGKSLTYLLAGAGWSSASSGGTAIVNFTSSTSTATPTATTTSSATPTPASNAVSSILLDAADKGPLTVGNSWWQENANGNSIVKYVIAGETLTLNYTVRNNLGAVVPGVLVTLVQEQFLYLKSVLATYNGATVGVTDANGRVTFTLVNTNTDANSEYLRSDLNVWSDTPGIEVKGDFIPYISSAGSGACYSTENGSCGRDRVWTHVVSSTVTNPSATPTTPTPTSPTTTSYACAADSTQVCPPVSNITLASDGVAKAATGGTVSLDGGKNVTFTYTSSALDAGKHMTVDLFDYSAGLVSTVPTNPGGLPWSSTGCFPSGYDKACQIELDANGGATFTVSFTGNGLGASFKYHIVGPTFGSDFVSASFVGGIAATATPTPTISVLPASAPTITRVVASNGSATLVIEPPLLINNSSLTGYDYSINNGSTWSRFASVGGPFVIRGLSNGSTYQVKVRAVNSAGPGVVSGTVEVNPTKLIPAQPVVSSVIAQNQSAIVHIATPTDVTSQSVTGYQYSTDKGKSYQDAVVSDGSFLISGLPNGTSVSVIIRALNFNGTSKASSAKSVRPVSVPDAPVIGSITSKIGELSVAFTAPNNGGSTITRYEYSLDAGVHWVNPTRVTNKSPMKISGLTNGTGYQIRIRAVNAAGIGTQSSISEVSTPVAIASAPGFAGAVAYKTSVWINLIEPTSNGGAAVTNYAYTLDGKIWMALSPASVGTEFIISGLTSNKSYTIKLRAINSAGLGAISRGYAIRTLK